MKILAISGSARRQSTNTALLRAVAAAAPAGLDVAVFDGVDRLPVFSPDLDDDPPAEVRAYIGLVEASDGVIVASPEYVRALPGGMKNAIDWLVSRDTLVGKPMALMHASHRGDDMLDSLRAVLATVSNHFAPELFLRFPLMKMPPAEIAEFLARPQNAAAIQAYLGAFARLCAAR
ncbi:MAG TPA: NADPH-dependent FMN reductase [Roseiarcus sp.]|nr:NADPH-dependent FMN reductase [Roseiarcus sp.]